jgi:DNA-directed RNA polymerase subunit N (RpoN/RPB10)
MRRWDLPDNAVTIMSEPILPRSLGSRYSQHTTSPPPKRVRKRVHAGCISAPLLLDRALTSQHKSLFDGIGKQYACCRRLLLILVGISIGTAPPGQFTRHSFSQHEFICFFFLFEIVVPRYSRNVIAVCSHGYANATPCRRDYPNKLWYCQARAVYACLQVSDDATPFLQQSKDSSSDDSLSSFPSRKVAPRPHLPKKV